MTTLTLSYDELVLAASRSTRLITRGRQGPRSRPRSLLRQRDVSGTWSSRRCATPTKRDAAEQAAKMGSLVHLAPTQHRLHVNGYASRCRRWNIIQVLRRRACELPHVRRGATAERSPPRSSHHQLDPGPQAIFVTIFAHHEVPTRSPRRDQGGQGEVSSSARRRLEGTNIDLGKDAATAGSTSSMRRLADGAQNP